VIVDGHHHVWRVQDNLWLQGPMLPRIFGPYEPIRRDYLADEFIADATGAGVTQSVYVQTNWPLERSLDEVQWVQRVHEESGWPHAIVGAADLFSEEAPALFEAQAAASPLMRGIRLQLHWHEHEQYRFASAPDRMNDPVLRRNVARLAEYGWVFELQVFSGQMADAARFVAELPEVRFVLVHSGMLESTAPEHVEPWRAGMEQLAALPNLVTKLTGQGTFVHRVDPELIGLVTDACLDWFGADRCLWGSNFPVESLWTDYGSLMEAWQRALADRPDAVRSAVLGGTAARVYRL
jgi:predicted TIM-barrel fold metal-dependent hydrolase